MIHASLYQDCLRSAMLERRQFQRLAVALQVELRVPGDSVPVRLQTTDVSAGGCYLEIAFTYDIGTLLNVSLWLGDRKLALQGKIVTRHPQFGNGIEFTNLSDEAKEQLQKLLEAAMNENSAEAKVI